MIWNRRLNKLTDRLQKLENEERAVSMKSIHFIGKNAKVKKIIKSKSKAKNKPNNRNAGQVNEFFMQCKCCRWLIGSANFFCWGDGPPLQTDEQWTKVPASRMTAFRTPAMLAVCHNYTKQPIRYSSRLYENNKHELTNTTLTQKHSHVESGWNKYENDKIYHTFDGVCVFHFAYQWHFNWKYQRNKSQIEMERTGLEEGGGCMSSDYSPRRQQWDRME